MIYLDNNATTRIDNDVLDTMLPYLMESYGNASSLQHKLGRAAHQAVEKSREMIAHRLHANPKEIYFTSGATESISTVIQGVFSRYTSIGNHIITCKTEHKAVLSACEALEKKDAKITYLPLDDQGQISLPELASAITDQTILVTIMSVNNETGVQHPIHEIAAICEAKHVLFFCDATQSIGKQSFDLSQIPIDILCFSAHKFHGPKGIGGLFIRRKSRPIQIEPLIVGGNQEHGFRAGTYNVANIIGLAKALEITNKETQEKITSLRDYFEQKLIREIAYCYIVGKDSLRIGNTSNIVVKYIPSGELMAKLSDIAISSGSACISGDRSPSHVLKAMHFSDEDALSCLRFSFSKYNTVEEIDMVIIQLKLAIEKLRASSPIWQLYKAGLLD